MLHGRVAVYGRNCELTTATSIIITQCLPRASNTSARHWPHCGMYVDLKCGSPFEFETLSEEDLATMRGKNSYSRGKSQLPLTRAYCVYVAAESFDLRITMASNASRVIATNARLKGRSWVCNFHLLGTDSSARVVGILLGKRCNLRARASSVAEKNAATAGLLRASGAASR